MGVNETTKPVPEAFKFLVTQKTPKLSFLSRMKPSKLPKNWESETEEVVVSSEEDFSSNLKKRTHRKRGAKSTKKSKPEEAIIDDSDDGITKSIYEMYYKHRPRNLYRQKSSEEQKVKNKKVRRLREKNDYDYDSELTTQRYFRTRNKRGRRRGMTADMPFFITDGRRQKTAERENFEPAEGGRRLREKIVVEDVQKEIPAQSSVPLSRKRKDSGMEVQDYSDEEDLDIEREAADRRQENNRRKRMLPKDDEAPSPDTGGGTSEPVDDMDFVVTLRPTQIRTFVIWFETNRKNYNT